MSSSSKALAYIHIPKAGGRTFDGILARSYGLQHCDPVALRGNHSWYTAEELRSQRWLFPRLRSVGGHLVKYFSDIDRVFAARGMKLYYFTIVRDPVKRMLSQFHHYHRLYGVDDIHHFLTRPRFQNHMCTYLADDANADKAIEAIEGEDFVLAGMQEDYDRSLLMLKKFYGDPKLDIRYTARNVAPATQRDHAVENHDEIVSIIREHNQADIRLFEYIRDDYFPRKKREYGDSLDADLARFRQENQNVGRNLNSVAYKLRDKFYRAYCGLHSGHIVYILRLKRYRPLDLMD